MNKIKLFKWLLDSSGYRTDILEILIEDKPINITVDITEDEPVEVNASGGHFVLERFKTVKEAEQFCKDMGLRK